MISAPSVCSTTHLPPPAAARPIPWEAANLDLAQDLVPYGKGWRWVSDFRVAHEADDHTVAGRYVDDRRERAMPWRLAPVRRWSAVCSRVRGPDRSQVPALFSRHVAVSGAVAPGPLFCFPVPGHAIGPANPGTAWPVKKTSCH